MVIGSKFGPLSFLKAQCHGPQILNSLVHFSNIADINSSAPACFNFCSFSHVLRSSNCMAHALASWASFCSYIGSLVTLPAQVLEAEKVDGPGPTSSSF